MNVSLDLLIQAERERIERERAQRRDDERARVTVEDYDAALDKLRREREADLLEDACHGVTLSMI